MMKRILIWIISVIFLFSFVSLSVSCKEETPTAAGEEAMEEEAMEEEAMEEEAMEEEAAEPVNIVIWWWGEQYVPGFEAYLDESVAIFEENNPNITVELTLQGTDVVLSQFPMAVAAGEGPDIQFTWDGIYTIPWVWLDYLEPLDNLFTPEELDNMLTVGLSQYDGKIYRSGFWDGAGIAVYNKDLFAEAGLDPEKPLETWDDLLNACEKLKAAGITPIGYGAKDLFAGEHMLSLGIQASMDSFGDLVALSEGTQSWADERYYSFWGKFLELFEKGYTNPDLLSIGWSEGHDLFLSGEVAMSEPPFSIAKLAEDKFGEGSVGIVANGSWPGLADGKWAGKQSPEAMGGWTISAISENKEEAAEFIRFLHSEERMNAMWDQTRSWPSDKRFDYESKLTSPAEIEIYEKVLKPFADDPGNFAFWASLILPPPVMNDIGYGIFAQIFTGDMTPEEMGQVAQDSMDQWKVDEPDFAENYIRWLKEMDEIYGG
ncbi:ABC transporter substrate-binding protein [Actinomycetota bacterium]